MSIATCPTDHATIPRYQLSSNWTSALSVQRHFESACNLSQQVVLSENFSCRSKNNLLMRFDSERQWATLPIMHLRYRQATLQPRCLLPFLHQSMDTLSLLQSPCRW